MSIEKDIVDSKLGNSLLTIECNAKHNRNGDRIYHGIKSPMKINAQQLEKAFSDKASFLLCNRAVGVLFDAKHPFFSHNILLRSRGN